MPISSVTSATTPQAAAAAGAAPAPDRDTFLKLLVAQLSHQDPLQPTQGTEFVAQLAQFSMVEQSIAQSAKLDTVSLQLSGIASNEAVGLVGKQVTVRGDALTWDGTNPAQGGATLATEAASVKATIVDAQGNAVRTVDLGGKPAGALSYTWDGLDDSGNPVPAGTYSVRFTATSAAGTPVTVTSETQGTVKEVSFDKGYPEMLLENGVRAAISELIRVADPPAAAP
jgi:flagellar basal-body rod modification protein FlgD